MLFRSGVPFVFHTKTVQNLVNSVSDFSDFFQTAVRYPYLVTEFHLYSGFVIANGLLDKLYTSRSAYSVSNLADFEVNNFNNFVKCIYNKSNLTASIHRNVYKLLSCDQLKQWAEFLVVKELLQNSEELALTINTFINNGDQHGIRIRL